MNRREALVTGTSLIAASTWATAAQNRNPKNLPVVRLNGRNVLNMEDVLSSPHALWQQSKSWCNNVDTGRMCGWLDQPFAGRFEDDRDVFLGRGEVLLTWKSTSAVKEHYEVNIYLTTDTDRMELADCLHAFQTPPRVREEAPEEEEEEKEDVWDNPIFYREDGRLIKVFRSYNRKIKSYLKLRRLIVVENNPVWDKLLVATVDQNKLEEIAQKEINRRQQMVVKLKRELGIDFGV